MAVVVKTNQKAETTTKNVRVNVITQGEEEM